MNENEEEDEKKVYILGTKTGWDYLADVANKETFPKIFNSISNADGIFKQLEEKGEFDPTLMPEYRIMGNGGKNGRNIC